MDRQYRIFKARVRRACCPHPSPADGEGFLSAVAPRLQLLEVKTIGQEVFLHYQVLTGE